MFIKKIIAFTVVILMVSLVPTKGKAASYSHSGYGYEIIGSLGDNNKRILTGSIVGEQEFFSWLSMKYTGGFGALSTNIADDRNILYAYVNPSVRFYPFKQFFFIDFGADLLYSLNHYDGEELWKFTVAPTAGIGFIIPSPSEDFYFTIFYKASYIFDHNVFSYWYNKLNATSGVLLSQVGIGFQFTI